MYEKELFSKYKISSNCGAERLLNIQLLESVYENNRKEIKRRIFEILDLLLIGNFKDRTMIEKALKLGMASMLVDDIQDRGIYD